MEILFIPPSFFYYENVKKQNLLDHNIKNINNAKTRRNQKVFKNENIELGQVLSKMKIKQKQKTGKQSKLALEYPSCKQRRFSEFDKGYYCENCDFIVNKQKHQ